VRWREAGHGGAARAAGNAAQELTEEVKDDDPEIAKPAGDLCFSAFFRRH
jgi:hypothetical protein